MLPSLMLSRWRLADFRNMLTRQCIYTSTLTHLTMLRSAYIAVALLLLTGAMAASSFYRVLGGERAVGS